MLLDLTDFKYRCVPNNNKRNDIKIISLSYLIEPPETSYLEEAEEFISQQHENSIKQVYRVKREQAHARKIEKTVENYDLALPF